MSAKLTNILLSAAIAATTVLASTAPVSATPVWLPGKVRGQPHLDEKPPEVLQAERQERARRLQERRDEQARLGLEPNAPSTFDQMDLWMK